MDIFSAGASIIGGLGSMAGGLFGGGGNEKSYLEELQEAVATKQLEFQGDILDTYRNLYGDYYWPIEEFTAGNYLTDIKQARPYQERMRDYQLGRGDELIALATDTNPILDENKKSLIRRLTEGEDVLADRYRSQASNDVAASYGQQRSNLNNQMALYGINPNSGAWANKSTSLSQGEALAQANARTNASRQAEDVSLQRQAQALNYYTNPSMLYDPGTITPGMSLDSFMGGSGGGGVGRSSSSSGGSGGENGIFSGLASIGSGLDIFNDAFGWIKGVK